MTACVSRRERVAGFLDRRSALAAVMHARRLAPISTLSILTYHRIAEIGDHDPYDPDVVDATPAQFRRQLETLLKVGTPICLAGLLASLNGAALPPNPMMVTFDDGYRSCREIALPILQRLGVPATFFVATTFASVRKLYWWEQIALALRAARGRTATLWYPRPMYIDPRHPGARRQLNNIVKNTRGLHLERFLSTLREALKVTWNPEIEAAFAEPLIMTWADIRALADAGMDVESHTCNHRVLETLDDDQLREELVGSRRDLEVQLGRQIRAIAYPVGRRPSVRIRRAVAEAGYRIAFTNGSGVNRLWPPFLRGALPMDPFVISRLPTERTLSDAMFLAQIALPRLR